MAQQSHAAAECRVHDQLLRLEVVLLHGHDRQRCGPRQRDALHLLLRRDFSRKQRRDALTDQSLAHPRLPFRRGLNRAFLVVEIVRPFRGEEHLRAVVTLLLLLLLLLLLGKERKKEREEQRSGKSPFFLSRAWSTLRVFLTVAKGNKKHKKRWGKRKARASPFKNQSKRTSCVKKRRDRTRAISFRVLSLSLRGVLLLFFCRRRRRAPASRIRRYRGQEKRMLKI